MPDERDDRNHGGSIGHNGYGDPARLKECVDRVELLRAERRALADDIKDLVTATAEATGISKKAITDAITLREKSREGLKSHYRDVGTVLSAMREQAPWIDEDDEPGFTGGAPAAPAAPSDARPVGDVGAEALHGLKPITGTRQ